MSFTNYLGVCKIVMYFLFCVIFVCLLEQQHLKILVVVLPTLHALMGSFWSFVTTKFFSGGFAVLLDNVDGSFLGQIRRIMRCCFLTLNRQKQ